MADPIEPDQNATSAGVTSIPEMIGKGAPSGVCDLDAAAVVPMSRIPMAVGGTGGLTSTPTQIVAHSMTGTATLGLTTGRSSTRVSWLAPV